MKIEDIDPGTEVAMPNGGIGIIKRVSNSLSRAEVEWISGKKTRFMILYGLRRQWFELSKLRILK